MSEIVTIASNAVTAKLIDPSRDVKLLVQSLLSYKVKGVEQMPAFTKSGWDGRSSLFDFRSGTFPAGFVLHITAHLSKRGYKVNNVRKPAPPPLGPPNPKVDDLPDDPRYDFQDQIPELLVKHRQIIAQVATGGGKSRIARKCFARINRPTLFLTTRGILMYQMADSFKRDMGIDVSILGDGQFGHTTADGRQAVKKMSLGMVQTLVSKLEERTVDGEVEKLLDAILKKEKKEEDRLVKRLAALGKSASEINRAKKALGAQQDANRLDKKALLAKATASVNSHNLERERTIRLLKVFEFVILEEAHEVSGDSYYKILQHCSNAVYRLALTGTPFMKDDEEANMRLMAVSGPIGIKVSEKTLIDRGILAKPYFRFLKQTNRPAKLFRTTAWAPAYRIGIVDNAERNAMIVAEAARAARHRLPTIILVQQTRHGEILQEQLRQKGVRCSFIHGEDDQPERKRELTKLANGDIDVLIGTTILDVGVDVPAVYLVVLAGGGKAEVALRQRIGRGARAKKHGPNIFMVVDFQDEWNSITKEHAATRRAIVESTPGFAEGVLPDGVDFDYEGLGLAKLAA